MKVDEPTKIMFSDCRGVTAVPSQHDGRGVSCSASYPILGLAHGQGERDERGSQIVSADGDPVCIALKEFRPFLTGESQSFSKLQARMVG